jgi:hypothetical protein
MNTFGKCQSMMNTDKYYNAIRQIAKMMTLMPWVEAQLEQYSFKNSFKDKLNGFIWIY